jgi:hypothetical protein
MQNACIDAALRIKTLEIIKKQQNVRKKFSIKIVV